MKKALILNVGNRYYRAIKSIEMIKPDLVYFIYSSKNEHFKNKIINECYYHDFEEESEIIVDYQSIKEAYSLSKQIFKEVKRNNFKIFVGVSNGTKAMITGLSLASVGYDCEFIYVGSTDDGREEDTGDVIQGHENPIVQFHPMVEQAVIEINRGKRYFNNVQFDEALNNFKQAKFILNNDNLIDMYIKITNLYKNWDKFENMIPYFNIKRNKHSELQLDYYLNNYIYKEINNDDELKNYFFNDENEFILKLEKNINFLENKISKKGLIKENDIYYYLVDLLNNAKRRIDEEKYDDATARLYRISELIAQIRLYEIGLVDSKKLKDHKVFHIDKLKLIETKNLKAIEYVARQPDFQNPKEKTIKIGLKESYNLLELLDDDLAKKFLADKTLDNLLSNRNDSILAHGLNPADENNTIDLFNKLLDYARDTFSECDKYIEYAKFPKFKNIDI